MNTLLQMLPTNRSRIYVRCVAKDGCLVYAPALNAEHAVYIKKELNALLAQQPGFDEPPRAT